MEKFKLINIISENRVYIAVMNGIKVGDKINVTKSFYTCMVNFIKNSDGIVVTENNKRYKLSLQELEPLPKERLVNEHNRCGYGK